MPQDKSCALEEKEKGNEKYRKKEFEEALSHYEKAILLDPTEMIFFTNKAAVYFEQGKYELCIAECEKAIEIGRENKAPFKNIAVGYSRMAGACAKLKKWDKAKSFYQKALAEHRSPDTVKKLAEVEKIIDEAERKAYINPEKALEEKNKGNEAFQRGDYPTAAKCYTEAIKRNPSDAVLYSNRAACYQKLAEFRMALKDAESCIERDPGFVRGYVRKGMALVALKDFSKAAGAFRHALELDPNNQEALDGYKKCRLENLSDPETVRRDAMSDPEVMEILRDPAMRIILEQMSEDPNAVKEHLRNPVIEAKVRKLLECGLIRIQ